MASHYAKYVMERTEDLIVETAEGFVTYRYVNHDGLPSVYIVDIYVDPDFRNVGAASKLADIVVKEARDKGATRLLGSVVPSTNNSTTSLKVLLGYGMTLHSATNDFIVFRKEL
jgi:ribosomal protein S18 acetylase RimI-like enzyme